MVDWLLGSDGLCGTDAAVYQPTRRARLRLARRRRWTLVGLVVCAAIIVTALFGLR